MASRSGTPTVLLVLSLLFATQLIAQQRSASAVPRLSAPRGEPIDLLFPEPVSVKRMYDALAQSSGLTILFDPKLRDQQAHLELRAVTPMRALGVISQSAGHFYKILDERTVLVAADTPQNRRTYENLIIKTFFLENARAPEMMTLLRSIIDARKLALSEDLNALTMRDTAEKVEVAQRLLDTYDRPKSEVAVHLELLRAERAGLRRASAQLRRLRREEGGEPGGVGLPERLDVEELAQLMEETAARHVAAPKLSLVDGGSASVELGGRVPIRVETPGQGQRGPGNVSYQYQEVGVRIQLVGWVHSETAEVTLEIEVDASCVDPTGSSAEGVPLLRTLKLSSTARLGDGETLLLSGLTPMTSGGEASVMCVLESGPADTRAPRELLLAATPRIVRRIELAQSEREGIWVGTEGVIELPPEDP